ncbi:MAG: hypothetical protein OMM_09944 [Candidatus Magnetoglobus multicellularis str. Araruama]|uniref:Core-binding (CB) domain-containing protein n=1 Tax=Candidatus Magnetoglobus multicellularis str. Araruama TaxID=890399 RepID=A0A1V1P2S3_9BACT|nr:MAG: hypothetical protein OMM_09944 [Candidatus Magnetoglobus multicellularis str. Araruama]
MLLLDKGYARYTIKFKVRQLSKLGHWLDINKINLNALNEKILDRYLESRINDSMSIGQLSTYLDFLEYLRDKNLICSDSTNGLKVPLDKEKQNFSDYLSKERNLVKLTIHRYTSLIVPFLEKMF